MASQAFFPCTGDGDRLLWTIKDERRKRTDPPDELSQAVMGRAISGELRKLRLDVSQATIWGYLPRRSKTVPDWAQLSANRPTDPSTCSLS